MNDPSDKNLGFFGLAALVFGMMVGAGIFNIPQNMAETSGPTGIVLSWLLTAAGMLLLVFTFKILADRYPEYNAGMYLYARHGFGSLAGFLTAWGYWLCTAFANVAYAVMLNDTMGSFFPSLLRHGWEMLLFGSCLIWIVFFIVKAGMKTAAMLNNAMGILKVISIVLIIILLAVNMHYDMFSAAFMADSQSVTSGGLWTQIKDSMLITLWCFIGIEGAVMMSGRARRSHDIGKAGITGFFSAWILYFLVSILCFGVMNRARLAGLDSPSVAYVLREACGSWAHWLIVISVLVSLSGGWIAWSLVTAEVPYMASVKGLFPRKFMKLNRYGIPVKGLFVSSIIMNLFLIIVAFSDKVYTTALSVTGMMILPAYLLTGLFLWKISRGCHRAGVIIGVACTIFCLWMIYAGGLLLFMETSLFYLAGLSMYFIVRREQKIIGWRRSEILMITLIAVASIASAILLATC